MSKTLTPVQIERIFEFTAQKYIKYYDVQLELVDHIASRIEDMMMEDSELSFEDALQKVYKSFGIFGFTKVQEQRVAEMQQYWRLKFWDFFKRYLKLPMLALTVTLSILIATLLQYGGMYIIMAIMVLYVLFSLIRLRQVLLRRKREKTKKHKLLYKESLQMAADTMISSFFIPFYNVDLLNALLQHTWVRYLLAIYITSILIVTWIIRFELPTYMNEQVRTKFSHLKLSI